MDEQEIRRRIARGRAFITKFAQEGEDEEYKTDQELKRPQPPLAKAAVSDTLIDLPVCYEKLPVENDFLHVINTRESHRVYTEKPLSLLALSYLLWCTQGIKEIRGRAYATLRTVPCGGARHEFECYMTVQQVEGLAEGLYHYLPLTHQLEFLGGTEDMRGFISDSLCGQSWAAKANVVFYYSCVFYRAEWRYGIWAHAPILMDSGHVTQNLYLAATSIGLGGCAVAAVEPDIANDRFGLDGLEETVFYAMPVGTVEAKDKDAEQDFYRFVKEQGL